MRPQQGLGRQRAKTICRAHRVHRKEPMHFPAAAGAARKLPIAATSTDAEPPKYV
jgi:hypothetical protein